MFCFKTIVNLKTSTHSLPPPLFFLLFSFSLFPLNSPPRLRVPHPCKELMRLRLLRRQPLLMIVPQKFTNEVNSVLTAIRTHGTREAQAREPRQEGQTVGGVFGKALERKAFKSDN